MEQGFLGDATGLALLTILGTGFAALAWIGAGMWNRRTLRLRARDDRLTVLRLAGEVVNTCTSVRIATTAALFVVQDSANLTKSLGGSRPQVARDKLASLSASLSDLETNAASVLRNPQELQSLRDDALVALIARLTADAGRAAAGQTEAAGYIGALERDNEHYRALLREQRA